MLQFFSCAGKPCRQRAIHAFDRSSLLPAVFVPPRYRSFSPLWFFRLRTLAALLVLLFILPQAHAQSIPSQITVSARVNTGAVTGDADDPAIWIHPDDAALSVVIGTDKVGNYVYVWDMNGLELQRVSVSSTPNNGDVRYGMEVGGAPVDIYVVGADNPSRVVVFKINPGTRTLSDITTAGGIPTSQVKEPYGVCLYRRAGDGAMYVFVNSNGGVKGTLNQYQLLDDGAGKVRGVFVRSFGGDVNGEHSEGMVADDALGYVYISQEDCCVHKFHANPNMGNSRLAVFAQGDGIDPDREGLGIYGCADGTGYILLSSQGNREVKVYRREGDAGNPHSHTLLTTISTPDVGGTDGLDVTNRPAGPNFPFGFLAKHNSLPKNFALIAWEDIAQTYLTICPEGPTSCDVTSNFSADATSICATLAVNFTDQTTGPVTAWSWNFGDGNTSTEQNPSHAYTAAGTYTVILTATSAACDDIETKTNYVTVQGVPGAAFVGNPVSGNAPLAVNFTDQSTNSPTSWNWDFGDGGVSTLRNPSHTYNAAGDYTVMLTADNACGSTAETKVNYIHVDPCAPPAANFVGTPVSGAAPLTVNFTDQSTNSPTSWSWDFGDGGVSTLQNPSHAYNAAGNYTVMLTVTNFCGSDAETKASYITVTAPPPGNLALNKPATASSSYLSFTANRAVDGVASGTSYWRSLIVSKTSPKTWLRVDLGAAYLLNRGVVTWRENYFAKKYRFQISTTGGSSDAEWTTVYTNNAGNSGTQNLSFTSPFAARYFRIRMDENNKGNNQVYELECYAGGALAPLQFLQKEAAAALAEPVLGPNHPNPFNPSTTLRFDLPQAAHVALKIYNLAGQEVATLMEGELEAGSHQFRFEAAHLPSGLYFAVLQAGSFRQVQRVVLMK